MLVYWILFLVPVYFLLVEEGGGNRAPRLVWLAFGLFLIILIGLREQIGCDWITYMESLELTEKTPFGEFSRLITEPGYSLLNWISLAMGTGIYGVNVICAVIFTGGLLHLCREQPYPWLAVVAAIPYLVIVVAMGYTRQAVAIGFMMYAFGYLLQGRLVVYVVLIALAALFHKTALVFLSFPLLRPGSRWQVRALGLLLLAALLESAFLVNQAEFLMLNYVEHTMESQGGLIRVLMNLPPALVLLAFWKKWGKEYEDRWLWGMFAVFAIVCVPLVTKASTAVDRMALYLIPLQLVVWARLPVLVQGRIPRIATFLSVILLYAAALFVWLNFAIHAFCWVPYDNLLLPPV